MTASSTANGVSVADSVDPPGFDLASTRPGDEKRDHEAILHNFVSGRGSDTCNRHQIAGRYPRTSARSAQTLLQLR